MQTGLQEYGATVLSKPRLPGSASGTYSVWAYDYCKTLYKSVKVVYLVQAGDQSEEMHQRLKELGVAVPTEDIAPALPQVPQPLGNIIPAPSMGVGMPYPLMPQITLGPTEFLSVNGMVTADVLVDDEEYREVSSA